jgi:hypothetical protein
MGGLVAWLGKAATNFLDAITGKSSDVTATDGTPKINKTLVVGALAVVGVIWLASRKRKR